MKTNYYVMEYESDYESTFKLISTHFDLISALNVAENAPNRIIWNDPQFQNWQKEETNENQVVY